MKKNFLMVAIAAMTLFGVMSCISADDEPRYIDTLITQGLFIINSGDENTDVESSLTYFDYSTRSASQRVYQQKNGEMLGMNATDATIYGQKLYIVGSGDKSIVVANRKDFSKITRISTGEYTPRRIAAANGYVYVTTHSNKILAIDTLSFSIQKTFDCGPYAEGIAVMANHLFVANSNKGNGGASISDIDTESGKVTESKNDMIKNPTDLYVYGNHLFYLDQGTIGETQTGNGVYELFANNTSVKLCDATMAAMGSNGYLYTINAPYNSTAAPTYLIYDVTYRSSRTMADVRGIDAPAAIAVDPVNGYVVITSYRKVNGVIDYHAPGYAQMYTFLGERLTYTDESGKRVEVTFDTNVGPKAACFNITTERIRIN